MLDKILGVSGSGDDDLPPQWDPATHLRLVHARSAAGVLVDEDTALTFGAVFSAVKVISETVSLLPWRPYRESGGRRELLVGTSLDRLLHRRPNDEMTAFQLREYLVACALLHGNGYCEIETTRIGEPVALHPIHPNRVEPKRDTRGALYYRVRGEAGLATNLSPRHMFHLRGPTKDGISGRSVLSLASESWGLGIAAEQFAAAFFGNGAVPSYFLEQGPNAPQLSPEGAQNMLASFERRHKGARRAGKPALLEPGFTVKAVGIPQKDAQFLETRKFSVTDVARWFRVPPHKIADMEKATFSNIEEQERNFVNDAIMPWAVRLEQEASSKLVTEDDVTTKIDVRALLRGTNKDRAEFYTKMRDLGALDINEIRALEDMNPIEGGELRLVPANMVSIERAGQPAQPGNTQITNNFTPQPQPDQTTPPEPTNPVRVALQAAPAASAVRGVLLDAHERMLSKEARAVERARGSDKDFAAWAKEFYARHEVQLRDALMPGASAFGAIQQDLDIDLIAGVVEAHARLLCETSIAAAVSNAAVVCDAKTVAAQTDRLIGRLIGASNA